MQLTKRQFIVLMVLAGFAPGSMSGLQVWRASHFIRPVYVELFDLLECDYVRVTGKFQNGVPAFFTITDAGRKAIAIHISERATR